VLELVERTQREAELNLELQHRVNNNLTVIQGLARLMLRHAQTPEGYYAAFSERLLAISEANQILSRRGWEIAVLPELAETALRPFRTKGQIVLDGPPCELPTRSCVPLVLALHELSTNAVKYGALSVPNGRVRVQWTVEAGRCRLTWREEDGPPVPPPTRQGLGSRLLRPQPGLESVTLVLPPTGAVCEMVIEGARALRGTR
jgi:two-component sensor histidine kinase